jgi:hypothetical protein
MEAVNIFEDVIARFETETAAMVFDQVDNPGGSMFQMYALLAMLTERVLPLPQHQITISDDQVAVAKNVLADAQAGEALPSNERPSPELVSYSRFVLAEKEAGRGNAAKASNPVYLFGVAEIVPAKTRYTKRIVVLINELTFSAGEFLAAILQDNKRAILFGQRTVGAGGCVKQIPFPSTLNIVKKGLVSGGYLSITWTIARRTTGEYIENIGVQPDVICEEDAQSGFPSKSSRSKETGLRSGSQGTNPRDVRLASRAWTEEARIWPGIPGRRMAGYPAPRPRSTRRTGIKEAEERRAADHKHGRYAVASGNHPDTLMARQPRRREAARR